MERKVENKEEKKNPNVACLLLLDTLGFVKLLTCTKGCIIFVS